MLQIIYFLFIVTVFSFDNDTNIRSCFPKNTCSNYSALISKLNNNLAILGEYVFSSRNCLCDHNCIYYGDCCVDAPIVDFDYLDVTDYEFVCTKLRGTDSTIYVWNKCLEDWENDDVREFCEPDLNEVYDPIVGLPVSSLKTNITYKNIYCAICNHEDEVIPWEIQIGCGYDVYPDSDDGVGENFSYPTNGMEMLRNMKYNTRSGKWDLKYQVNGNFPSCSMSFRIPKDVDIAVRRCKPIIRKCAKNWKDDIIQTKCDSYNAYVYQYKRRLARVFKNVHCAMCNYVNISEIDCIDQKFFFVEYFPLSFSFSLNLNYNTSGGIVYKNTKCDTGFIYDTFAEKCRRVNCQYGYILNGSKCVPFKENEHFFVKIHRKFCPRFGINKSQFHFMSDQIIFVDDFNQTYTSKHYQIDNSGGAIICDPKLHIRFEIVPQCSVLNKSWILQLQDKDANNFIIFRWDEEDSATNSYCDFVEQVVSAKPPCLRLFWKRKEIYMERPKEIRFYLLKNITNFNNESSSCQQEINNLGFQFTLTQKLITIIMHLICLLFLLLYIVAYIVTSLFKTNHGKILLYHIITLILKQLCVVLSVIFHPKTQECTIIGIIFHVSFLSTYFWMSILIYDVWKSLNHKTPVVTGKGFQSLVLYSCFSWGLPFVLETLTLIVAQVATDKEFSAKFGYLICWISNRNALLLFFGMPLVITLIGVLILITMTGVTLLTKWQYPSIDQKFHRHRFLRAVALSFIVNCVWISMFIATYTFDKIWWFVFVVCNTLQGPFIFFAFTYNNKMKNLLRSKYKQFRDGKVDRESEINRAYVVSGKSFYSTNPFHSSTFMK